MRGIGLATYLRQIATEAARNVRRTRIRAQSAAVGRSVAEGPEARRRPTRADMAAFEPGQIVIVEWRDAPPREANRRRPAVVVEDGELFDPSYPHVILVPLTEDPNMVIAEPSVRIDPTPENGCTKTCFAVSPLVAGTSKSRVRGTGSRVTAEQLADIRRRSGSIGGGSSAEAGRPI